MHLRPLSPRLYLPVGFEAMGQGRVHDIPRYQDERVRGLRKQQSEEAASVRAKLAPLAPIIQAAPDTAW
jgi:hypothetical protein